VHVLLRERTAPLGERHPHVDRVIRLPDDGTAGAVLDAVRRERYDMAVIPHSTGAMAALVHRAGIPIRMGNAFRWHSWRYNVPVFQKRRVPARHELDYNLDLLRPWIPVPERDAVTFHLGWSDAAARTVRDFLAANAVSRYIIVHPGSGGSAVDLPAAGFAGWVREYPYPGHFIVTGSAAEAPLVDTVVRAAGGVGAAGRDASRRRVIDAAGRFSLEEMMALIEQCEFFLSNSTGPLHMARALDRPLLGIYTTVAACHPKRWGPYAHERTDTLLPPGESFDGFERDKTRSRRRMAEITPEMISAAVERVRARRETAAGRGGRASASPDTAGA